MKKAQLLTRDGREVTTVDLPLLADDLQPNVILWGTRFFQSNVFERTYVEVFGYVAPYINLPEGQG